MAGQGGFHSNREAAVSADKHAAPVPGNRWVPFNDMRATQQFDLGMFNRPSLWPTDDAVDINHDAVVAGDRWFVNDPDDAAHIACGYAASGSGAGGD